MKTILRTRPRSSAPGSTTRAETAGRQPALAPPESRAGTGSRVGARIVGVSQLGILAAIALLVDLLAIFRYAPTELVQGDVQRIFYVHVPLAIVAFGSFFVVFVASILYLWRRERRWDVWARSAAEIGVVLTTLVLVTGSLWAKPIWGTWWTWDARLTTTLVLWLIYLSYLLVRSYVADPERGARYAAVVGVVGFLDVPIIRQSVVWWRTLHPGPTIVQESGGLGMPPAMLATFGVSLVAFGLLYSYLLLTKVGIEQAADELAAAREQSPDRDGEPEADQPDWAPGRSVNRPKLEPILESRLEDRDVE